eukprot:316271_1
MGNHLSKSTIEQILTNETKKSQKRSKFPWSKSNDEDFIIKYNKLNERNNNTIDIKSLDQRRVIFVSLIGLFSSWRECPSFVLYSAIFLLKLKREWVYNPAQYVNEIKAHFVSQLNSFSDISETREFIKLLKWKDSQGLVMWMFDDYSNTNDKKSLIHPFWSHCNDKLRALYDPISKNKYNELDLDATYWQDKIPVKISLKNKYCTKTVSILSELYFLTAKFKPIQQIIYESNPNSLLPIVSYNHCQNRFKRLTDLKTTKVDFCQEFDIDENEQDWWISDDYDPYEF